MLFAKKKKKKGFTLIELLVVIAIIGILATIVIVNVNSARTKANDVAIKAALDQVRAQAELYYDGTGNNTYTGMSTGTVPDLLRIEQAIASNGGSAFFIAPSSSAYCAEAVIKSGTGWCVDSTGYAGASSTCAAADWTCQ